MLPTEHRRQLTAAGRQLDAGQPGHLVTSADEACRATEQQRFRRGLIGGGLGGMKHDVASEMVDRHRLQRSGLSVRSRLAIPAEDNPSYLLRSPLHLDSRKTSDPVAVLANVSPELQFHGRLPLEKTDAPGDRQMD